MRTTTPQILVETKYQTPCAEPTLDALQARHSNLFSHPTYQNSESASIGLSKKLGHEVSMDFVQSFFRIGLTDKVDLPPLPTKDDLLVQSVRDRFRLLNTLTGQGVNAMKFLYATFDIPLNKAKLSSYELQILLFVVNEGKALDLYFEPGSKEHGFQKSTEEPGVIIIGGRHHHLTRGYTPREAYETFLHEAAHARDRFYNHPSAIAHDNAKKLLRELRANIYSKHGNIVDAMREISLCYHGPWSAAEMYCPGFKCLHAEEQYKYLVIITPSESDEILLESLVHAKREMLIEAFPQIAPLFKR